MIGVVNLDKPIGPTSHDMVGLIRRLTGTRRIGHAGTLDPMASGVLPILVGAATRFSQELTAGPKRYDAVIRLGQRSATDDAEGPILPGGPPPAIDRLADALGGFVGNIRQRPPAYSARKQAGRRAYRAARAGDPLDLPPREVRVEQLALVETTPGPGWLDVRIDLRCGPGTYVRSIARDLGEALGCGGYLHALRRTEAAGLRVADAIDPDGLCRLAEAGRLADALVAVGDLLPLPHLTIDAAGEWDFLHGAAHHVGAMGDGRHAVFGARGLLGIGELRDGVLLPDKVIAAEAPA